MEGMIFPAEQFLCLQGTKKSRFSSGLENHGGGGKEN